MKKSIETLVEDIYDVIDKGVTADELMEHVGKFDEIFHGFLHKQLVPEGKEDKNGLRMSNIGSPCSRKLWYAVNEHDNKDREPLTGDTKIKFMYGDMTEDLILLLASLAGHKVEGMQDELEIAGIKGHRDCVIDGWVVDVKSASSYSFKKFKSGGLLQDDPFGYHIQLMSYLYASQDEEIVTEKDKAAFLVFDKQLGHLCLDIHEKPEWFDEIPKAYDRRKEVVASKEVPKRDFEPVPEGKSGNMKLGTFCSYCDFKKICYPELRTFLYSKGPVFLTEVKREPSAPEVKEEEDA